MYVCYQSSHCTLYTYTMLYVNLISAKLGEKEHPFQTPHFLDEETEAPKGEVSYSRSYSYK